MLSLDTELVWGSLDHTPPEVFARRYQDLRGVISELLVLLGRYDISATWAIVGHLFLRSCAGRHGDIVCGASGTREDNPLFFGDDVVSMVHDARPAQEIGSHSFVHRSYAGPPDDIWRDLMEVLRAGRDANVELSSFVFPRNVEGRHELLARAGFVAYRGADPTWFRSLPAPGKRLAHLIDQALALPPPVSVPTEKLAGLWDIPGSMLLLSRCGIRRAVPQSARVIKAKRGLRRAISRGRVFHLWFHPFNLAVDRVQMFRCLGSILGEVAKLRDAGSLDVKTMGQLARRPYGVRHGSPFMN